MAQTEAVKPAGETPGAEAAEAPSPPPEPITPEKVLQWNRYYDRYVAAGVLVAVFLVAATKIDRAEVWARIRTGELIVQNLRPVTADPFSFTREGQPWVNIPWLYDVVHYGIYSAAKPFTFGSTELNRGEQTAAGALVAVNAIARMLTALVLLLLARAGPGRWWVALCATLGLAGTWMLSVGEPGTLRVGGVAGVPKVSPETWGVLFLAIELAILFSAEGFGGRAARIGLPLLFLLWANVDGSFVIGLFILIAAVAAELLTRSTSARPAASLLTLALCAIAPLLTPSLWRTYPTALRPFVDIVVPNSDPLTYDRLSVFGPKSWHYFISRFGPAATWVNSLNYALFVGLGCALFLLNRRRFSLARFLVFAVACVLWACLVRLGAFFAVVLAATMALNGQEWYLANFGAEGRLGRGWTIWSVGGRAITILLLFLITAAGVTGFGKGAEEPVFGFGYQPAALAFEAPEYLRSPEGGGKIRGQVINFSIGQGDAIIGRAFPERKSFIDGRSELFRGSVRSDLTKLRDGLLKDDASVWRPIMDKYGASVVMLAPLLDSDRRLFESMSKNSDWIAFYYDGSAAMFGRADAEQDVAFFRGNRLDPDELVYKRPRTPALPMPDRPPSSVTWIDSIVQNRALAPRQPHELVARRWLPTQTNPDVPLPPEDIARCYLAIREARVALKNSPDDPYALFALEQAYALLLSAEEAILARASSAPPGDHYLFRLRQRLAALNFAIQTFPPSNSPAARELLAASHFRLAQLYLGDNSLDLARDQLQKAKQIVGAKEFPAELDEQLTRVNDAVEQFTAQLEELSSQQPLRPIQKAQLAMDAGFVGQAIAFFKEAEETDPAQARGPLVDLYNKVGQPDVAYYDIVGPLDLNDPSLGLAPGMAAYRSGMTNFLLGYYETTIGAWRDRALATLKRYTTVQVIDWFRVLSRGEPASAASQLMDLFGSPTSPGRLTTMATWHSELGFCLLEFGDPAGAAENFTKALELRPDLPTRALLAFYLEKMGKPVPAPPSGEAVSTPAPEAAVGDKKTEAKPADGKNE